MKLRATIQQTPPSMRALAYVGIAFLAGAITQIIQALSTHATAFADWRSYLVSLIVAALAGGLSAALPYLLAMLPAEEPPTPPGPAA